MKISKLEYIWNTGFSVLVYVSLFCFIIFSVYQVFLRQMDNQKKETRCICECVSNGIKHNQHDRIDRLYNLKKDIVGMLDGKEPNKQQVKILQTIDARINELGGENGI